MADGEKYYYRCIARYVALQSALSSPSKVCNFALAIMSAVRVV